MGCLEERRERKLRLGCNVCEKNKIKSPSQKKGNGFKSVEEGGDMATTCTAHGF